MGEGEWGEIGREWERARDKERTRKSGRQSKKKGGGESERKVEGGERDIERERESR